MDNSRDRGEKLDISNDMASKLLEEGVDPEFDFGPYQHFLEIIDTETRDAVENRVGRAGEEWFGRHFPIHAKAVVLWALVIAEEYQRYSAIKVNYEVLILAAILHDIGFIVTGESENHEVVSQEWIIDNRKRLGIDLHTARLVASCALTHRNDDINFPLTPEEDIIVAADSAAHLTKGDIVYYGVAEKFGREEALRKLTRDEWDISNLIPRSELRSLLMRRINELRFELLQTGGTNK